MPLWLPGFVSFLSRIPGFDKVLERIKQEFKEENSYRFSAGVAMYLFFALAKQKHDAVKKYVFDLLEKKPAQEVGMAAFENDSSEALRKLMIQWSYRPLLLGATCGNRSSGHLAQMIDTIKLNAPIHDVPAPSTKTTLEDIYIKEDGLPPAFNVHEMAKNVMNQDLATALLVLGGAANNVSLAWQTSPSKALRRRSRCGLGPLGILTRACTGLADEPAFSEHNLAILAETRQWFIQEDKSAESKSVDASKLDVDNAITSDLAKRAEDGRLIPKTITEYRNLVPDNSFIQPANHPSDHRGYVPPLDADQRSILKILLSLDHFTREELALAMDTTGDGVEVKRITRAMCGPEGLKKLGLAMWTRRKGYYLTPQGLEVAKILAS